MTFAYKWPDSTCLIWNEYLMIFEHMFFAFVVFKQICAHAEIVEQLYKTCHMVFELNHYFCSKVIKLKCLNTNVQISQRTECFWIQYVGSRITMCWTCFCNFEQESLNTQWFYCFFTCYCSESANVIKTQHKHITIKSTHGIAHSNVSDVKCGNIWQCHWWCWWLWRQGMAATP